MKPGKKSKNHKMKPTLVIGASIKLDRYSNIAIHRLLSYQHLVIAFGPKEGNVGGVAIETEWNPNWNVDTVTLYLNPTAQKDFYSKIMALKPSRVIFNPGTENQEFQELLSHENIAFENACTLVLLSLNQY